MVIGFKIFSKFEISLSFVNLGWKFREKGSFVISKILAVRTFVLCVIKFDQFEFYTIYKLLKIRNWTISELDFRLLKGIRLAV